MDAIWDEMCAAALAVQGDREISEQMSAGCVAAAVEMGSGRIYTGVFVDTACSLGACAERVALFSAITNGESTIHRVVALGSQGEALAPCGACREFMAQMMPGCSGDVEVLMDREAGTVATLRDLTPQWWV